MKRGVSQDIVAFYSSSLSAIEKQERIRESSVEGLQKRAEKMIIFLKDVIKSLRDFVSQYEFFSRQEEALFFKVQGPSLLHYLIFYAKMYTLELRTSVMNESERKKVLKEEKKVIERWRKKNEGFFRYYKSGATDLDDKYFLRNSVDMSLIAEPGQLLLTDTFITIPSYLVAELLANERLYAYLQGELKFTKQNDVPTNGKSPLLDGLVWTAPKAAAVEMVYHIYFAGFCNNGTAQLRQIGEGFEKWFNIDLGNMYRYAMDLKIKKNRHQYAHRMIAASEKGFDNLDEHPAA